MKNLVLENQDVEILAITPKAIGEEGQAQRDKVIFLYQDTACTAYPEVGLVKAELVRKKVKASLRFSANVKSGELKVQIIKVS